MDGPILPHEQEIRLGFFFGVLALMALWEALAPRRERRFSRLRRWPHNLAMVALGALLIRLLLPALPIGVALLAQQQGWGLLQAVQLPPAVALVAGVILLDLAIYLQHVMFHAVPALWRLHRMHHADLDFDVTTGVRFHPVELLLSAAIKLGVVAALGPPVLAVLVFEVLLNLTAMFNHGNVGLPGRIDRWLRLVVVTPDMHRVHHSIRVEETNSNFGFNLPWWDRLFGTYRAQPAAGHKGMTIGIAAFRDGRELRLDRLLLQPFRRGAGDVSMDDR